MSNYIVFFTDIFLLILLDHLMGLENLCILNDQFNFWLFSPITLLSLQFIPTASFLCPSGTKFQKTVNNPLNFDS